MIVSEAEMLPGCVRSGAFSKIQMKVTSNKKTASPSAPSMTAGESKRRKSKFIRAE